MSGTKIKGGKMMFRKIKCYFGFHDYDGPTDANVDSFYYCEGKCGSHIRWEQGLPRYGIHMSFGKARGYMVKVEE
jgi:hypothetical protein